MAGWYAAGLAALLLVAVALGPEEPPSTSPYICDGPRDFGCSGFGCSGFGWGLTLVLLAVGLPLLVAGLVVSLGALKLISRRIGSALVAGTVASFTGLIVVVLVILAGIFALSL
ncbi:hypothetical protein ABT297_20910 [Dactylosporangium sp. NPDC000555]|uniref:hypothetical protein n=1 Tax=Dactylosporangium sp. NPDC000555 TaxID=3154260 RepID=UPI0033221761